MLRRPGGVIAPPPPACAGADSPGCSGAASTHLPPVLRCPAAAGRSCTHHGRGRRGRAHDSGALPAFGRPCRACCADLQPPRQRPHNHLIRRCAPDLLLGGHLAAGAQPAFSNARPGGSAGACAAWAATPPRPTVVPAGCSSSSDIASKSSSSSLPSRLVPDSSPSSSAGRYSSASAPRTAEPLRPPPLPRRRLGGCSPSLLPLLLLLTTSA